jgi:predicted acylesterase/phospholipase RssA
MLAHRPPVRGWHANGFGGVPMGTGLSTGTTTGGGEEPHEPGPLIGETEQPVEVFAFRGGGFDAVMYLGVVHALVLLNRLPPHIVSGVSAGAVAAAALADVLGTSAPPCHDPTEQADADRRARAARLKEVVLAACRAPGQLITSLFPDAFEVEAERPLASLEQPTMARRERADRDEALRARNGIIKLLNHLLYIPLRLSALTRLVRIGLELVAAPEQPTRVRVWISRLRAGVALWISLALYGPALVFPVQGLLAIWFATIVPRSVRLVFGFATKPVSAGTLLSMGRRAVARTAWCVGLLLTVVAYYAVVLWPVTLWLLWHLARWNWRFVALLLLAVALVRGVPAIGAMLAGFRAPRPSRPWNRRLLYRVLDAYALKDELGTSYDLKRLLVSLFDREHYGALPFQSALSRALGRDRAAWDPSTDRPADGRVSRPRTLWDLRDARSGRLNVVPAVADLATGRLMALPNAIPGASGTLVSSGLGVVDALLASLAVVPFLRPASIRFRERREGPLRHHRVVDGTNIADEPTSAVLEFAKQCVNPDAGKVTIYVVGPFPSTAPPPGTPRYMTGLVEVVARVLELRRYQVAKLERRMVDLHSWLLPERAITRIGGKSFVNASIEPIEPDEPIDLRTRLPFAADERERQELALAAVAAGCRATLATLDAKRLRTLTAASSVHCREAYPSAALPGSAESGGPGLAEVCRRCHLAGTDAPLQGHLPLRATLAAPPEREPRREPFENAQDDAERARPWTTLVLSGGVFRGVFQIGVLTAVSEAGLRPRLLVGSSVGSLMAVMAARLFSDTAGVDRDRTLGRVAAAFLALDHLVLTDRFADFVRRLTLRAGSAPVSPRDVDRLLRRYELHSTDRFGRRARRVAAAVERLLYLSPSESLALAECVRQENWHEAARLGRAALQYYCDRSGVGLEVLGAEPLLDLVDGLALCGLRDDPLQVPFDHFQHAGPDPFYLLVTATNLQGGDLRVLGLEAAQRKRVDCRLADALLASSAFPGVFRPRYYSEVLPNEPCEQQFTDGGVMDNLPLHSVAQFFADADGSGLARRRPRVDGREVPHLVLTASLEPYWSWLSDDEMDELVEAWPGVRRRIDKIKYNQKVDGFAIAQEHLRALYQAGLARTFEPIDLDLVTVKSNWLCGTFAFHPMLHFRRDNQAASIAHGCASTLASLWLKRRAQPTWADAWSIGLADFDERTIDTSENQSHPTLKPRPHGDGRCHFRTNTLCPFAPARLAAAALGEPEVAALSRIHALCGLPETHLRAPA